MDINKGLLYVEHFFIKDKLVISADAILKATISRVDTNSADISSIGVIIRSKFSFLQVFSITL